MVDIKITSLIAPAENKKNDINSTFARIQFDKFYMLILTLFFICCIQLVFWFFKQNSIHKIKQNMTYMEERQIN
jgi:hypothetical protein